VLAARVHPGRDVTSDHYAFLRPPLVTRVASPINEWQAPLHLEENPQIVDA